MPVSHPIYEKVWGQEIWYVNTEQYCLKRLMVNPGYRCSWHRHPVKDETFLCESGYGWIDVEETLHGQAVTKSHHIEPGTTVHIPTGTWHRFRTHGGMTLIEVSTHHLDADVERRDQSGRINEE